MKEDEPELSNLAKFAILTGIALIMVIGIAVFAYLDRDHEPEIISCDTNLNPTACPEPDYDAELYETLKQYPDDSY